MLARIASTLAAGLLMSSCATTGSMEVNTQSEPGKAAEMQAYRTYTWAQQPPGTDPKLYPPGVETNVKDSVNRILQQRGYRLVEPTDNPDFIVGWHAGVETKLNPGTVDVHYGYYGGPFGVGYSQPVATEYDEGTLLLDIADAKSNKLVWRGVANARIERKVSDKDKRERIDKAVTKLLERFPPKPE